MYHIISSFVWLITILWPIHKLHPQGHFWTNEVALEFPIDMFIIKLIKNSRAKSWIIISLVFWKSNTSGTSITNSCFVLVFYYFTKCFPLWYWLLRNRLVIQETIQEPHRYMHFPWEPWNICYGIESLVGLWNYNNQTMVWNLIGYAIHYICLPLKHI